MDRRQFITTSTAALIAAGMPTLAFAAGGPIRIIFDTDPGTDDAMGILLALRSPELKIDAITPVVEARLAELRAHADLSKAAGGTLTPAGSAS